MPGALNAHYFNGLGGVPDAGSVYEAEESAADVYCVFYCVSGCALDRGDDGPFLAEDEVEEGALAGVYSSDNGDRNAVLDGVSK